MQAFRWSELIALGLYSLIGWMITPALPFYLWYRGLSHPAYREHWKERFMPAAAWDSANAGAKAGAGGATDQCQGVSWVWIHAVSFGETQAASALIRELRKRTPGCAILLSHGTPTGRRAGESLLASLGVSTDGTPFRQVYLPYDRAGSTRDFLRAYRPVVGIVVETEVWPWLMQSAAQLAIPMLLVSGRLSVRSLEKAQRFALLIKPALRRFSWLLMQTEDDCARVRSLLGDQCPPMVALGNLKFDVALAPALIRRGERMRQLLSPTDRAPQQQPHVELEGADQSSLEFQAPTRWIVCASTRRGEEAEILRQWLAIGLKQREGFGLVFVPRHPERFEELGLLLDQGVGKGRWSKRSELFSETLTEDKPALHLVAPGACAVILGDSMGEMAAWYALADCVVMGGSIGDTGSQNLIEPCAAGRPVVLGPSTYNFEDAARRAIEAGGAVQVPACEVISRALALAANPRECARRGEAALRFVEQHRGAAARVIDVVGEVALASGRVCAIQ
jgi:3-deoxy-D-manno-octulosonic-acid transferase